jgi:hypothetical protein
MFSDTNRPNLCTSWKNAVLNDCGVFIENRIDIDVYKTKTKCYPRITIHCALEYPKVYYSFDLIGKTRCGVGYPGRDSSNFDVHEHAGNVALMMEHALRSKICEDHKITENMIRDAIEKFKEAITSDDSQIKEFTTTCNRCKRQIPNCEILDHDGEKLCMDCLENKEFVDDETEDNDGWSICPTCKKKFRFLYDGLCLPCYEKKRKKSEKIARRFIAEGWKEVPDKEKESAMHEQNGWIDERNMDAFEPRKGTRFFLIDIKSLTWKCYFKRSDG